MIRILFLLFLFSLTTTALAQDLHILQKGIKKTITLKIDRVDSTRSDTLEIKKYDQGGRLVYFKDSNNEVQLTYQQNGIIKAIGNGDFGACTTIYKIEYDSFETRVFEYFPEGAKPCFLNASMDTDISIKCREGLFEEIPRSMSIPAPFNKVSIYQLDSSRHALKIMLTYARLDKSKDPILQDVIEFRKSWDDVVKVIYKYIRPGCFNFVNNPKFDQHGHRKKGGVSHKYEYDEHGNWTKFRIVSLYKADKTTIPKYFVRGIDYYE